VIKGGRRTKERRGEEIRKRGKRGGIVKKGRRRRTLFLSFLVWGKKDSDVQQRASPKGGKEANGRQHYLQGGGREEESKCPWALKVTGSMRRRGRAFFRNVGKGGKKGEFSKREVDKAAQEKKEGGGEREVLSLGERKRLRHPRSCTASGRGARRSEPISMGGKSLDLAEMQEVTSSRGGKEGDPSMPPPTQKKKKRVGAAIQIRRRV